MIYMGKTKIATERRENPLEKMKKGERRARVDQFGENLGMRRKGGERFTGSCRTWELYLERVGELCMVI